MANLGPVTAENGPATVGRPAAMGPSGPPWVIAHTGTLLI